MEKMLQAKRKRFDNEVDISSCSSLGNPPTHTKLELAPFQRPEQFLEIERTLAMTLSELTFTNPVSYVYNPIEYAFPVHALYVQKFCDSQKKVMFLGMNPGPWGMAQTGVPFGEVNIVRDWMGIVGEVRRPTKENPMRPVLGFACKRSEISGQRFWGLFKELCGDARYFFENAIVYNHCPIAFMTESGRNITPNELKISERKAVILLCDKALSQVITLFRVLVIIAIGRFAEKRAMTALKDANIEDVKVIFIPHPSPRNFGNAGKWKEIVVEELERHSLLYYFKRCSSNLETNSEIHIDVAKQNNTTQPEDSGT